MSRSSEAIANALDRALSTSMPVSKEDEKLRDMLLEALESSRQPEKGGSMMRGGLEREAETTAIEASYSFDDLLAQVDDILETGDSDEAAEQELYNLFTETVLRSRADSRLEAYDYDMVYAITQKALNATMKEYIDIMGAGMKPEIKYYVGRADQSQQGFHTGEATEAEAEFFDSLHLFDIPADEKQRTEEQKRRIEQADGKYLMYAFRGAFGIPENSALSQIRNIIELLPGQVTDTTWVRYNMYFRELSIIELKYNPFKRKAEFTKTSQDGQKPWVFRFKVNLGLIGVSRSELPGAVAEKVNNIAPDTMFSIQQLFLDLNTVQLQDALPIPDVSEEAAATVNDKFTKVYFQKLREQAAKGAIVFAYAIKPDKSTDSADRPFLMRPSDFCFYISPYYENGVENPGKGELYTLNYLLTCGSRMLPGDLKKFTWNWVDEKDLAYVHGSMSINKQRIYDFAVSQFKGVVKSFMLKPVVEISLIKVQNKIRFEQEDINVAFNNNKHSHFRQAEDGSFLISAKVKYSCDSSITSYQSSEGNPVIECRSDIVCYLDSSFAGGSSSGNIYNRTVWFTLTIGVDEYGGLILTPGVRETDNGTNFSYSSWSDIASMGLWDTVLNFTKAGLEGFVKSTKSFAIRDFRDSYNQQAMWVLPGDRTFLFKQPRFSQGKDLTFDISYARPGDR